MNREKSELYQNRFGINLKKELEQKGYTQMELAGCIGVSRMAVSRWVSGKQEPNIFDAYRIAKELGVTLERLTRKPLTEDISFS